MVQWKPKAEFHNENAILMQQRLNHDQAIYLDKQPSFYTYYHINTQRSTVNDGLQNVNNLLGRDAPIKFNKIEHLPIFGVETANVELEDSDYGLDSNYQGSGVIAPFTVQPMPNDFFIAEYLEKRTIFRVIKVNYQSVVSNEYYEIDFELYSYQDKDYIALENQTIHRYQCIFDNIGTEDKSVIRNEDYETLERIRKIQYTLRDNYLLKFRDPNYNALMFLASGDRYLYDPLLNHFCNKEKIFELDHRNTADCFLLYEETRETHPGSYEDSIYDRISHRDLSDLDQVEIYYDDLQPAIGTMSQFDYLNDRRVRYLNFYIEKNSVFGHLTKPYINKDFITALSLKNLDGSLDNMEAFVYHFMTKQDVLQLCNYIELVEGIRRIQYTLHNFVMIPLVLYCLRQLYKEIICDNSVMDEHLLTNNRIRELSKK